MTTTRRTAAPWGLVGMLALIALSEWAFTRVEMDVLLPEHWDWRNTGRAARSAAKADVLCFGDSLMKFSVLPTVVEARTGRTAYNLAVPMGQPPSSYYLLRRALAAGARPSAVLIDAAPFLLRMDPRGPRHLRLWPELLTPAELLDLASAARDPDVFAQGIVAKLLPTFRARQEIRAEVLVALKGEPSTRRFQAAQFARNARVNRGANAMLAPPGGPPDVDHASRSLFEGFACDPLNAAYLDRFLELAGRHGVPAFLVLTPPSEQAQRYAEGSGFDAAHTAFVESLCRRYPRLTVLDGRRSRYGNALYFMDPVHLNHRGSTVFSDDVAAALDRALTTGGDAPRRVDLPPYRQRPDAIDVEDVAESAVALTNRGSVRR